MPKCILFDFDGTIADSFENFLEIVKVLSEKNNLPRLSRDEIEELRDQDARSIIKKLKIPFYKIPQLARDMKALQAESLTKIHPFKGLPEVLQELKNQGYKLGIVTSNSERNVRSFLKKSDLELFESVQSDSSLFGKDRMIAKFLSRNGITREDVIYVGDEMRDIEACRRIGIPIVAVTWGFNSRQGLETLRPDYLIDSPEELPVILHTKGS